MTSSKHWQCSRKMAAGVKQKDYIFALEENGLLKDVTSSSGKRKEVTKKGYARAKRQYFEKLDDKKWIVKKGKGRSSFIEITKEGEYTLQTFIDVAIASVKSTI